MTVEFARQGIIIRGSSAERYVPIPTDAEMQCASVMVNGAVARMSMPTAGLRLRRRTIGNHDAAISDQCGTVRAVAHDGSDDGSGVGSASIAAG